MSTPSTAVLTTSHQINALRAHVLRIGLENEVRNGMRLTNKRRSAYAIIKSELGFTGTKSQVLAKYLLWMEEQGLISMDDYNRAKCMWASVAPRSRKRI